MYILELYALFYQKALTYLGYTMKTLRYHSIEAYLEPS